MMAPAALWCVLTARIIVEHARSPGSRTAASYDRRPQQTDRYVPVFLLISTYFLRHVTDVYCTQLSDELVAQRILNKYQLKTHKVIYGFFINYSVTIY